MVPLSVPVTVPLWLGGDPPAPSGSVQQWLVVWVLVAAGHAKSPHLVATARSAFWGVNTFAL